jgi:hypothetical protein
MSQQKHHTIIKTLAIQLHARVKTSGIWGFEIHHSPDPFRCIIDLGRAACMHQIAYGSSDYEYLVDCLESLESWNCRIEN